MIKSKLSFSSTLVQGKLPMKACYTVKSHLTRPQTLTAVKVSKQQPPQPCAFDTQLRARTVPGLFGKAGLDGKPLSFWEATMAWTRATLCSSENFSRYLLANSLRYQGPNAWNSVKNRLMTLDLLSLAHRMPFWRETRRVRNLLLSARFSPEWHSVSQAE